MRALRLRVQGVAAIHSGSSQELVALAVNAIKTHHKHHKIQWAATLTGCECGAPTVKAELFGVYADDAQRYTSC